MADFDTNWSTVTKNGQSHWHLMPLYVSRFKVFFVTSQHKKLTTLVPHIASHHITSHKTCTSPPHSLEPANKPPKLFDGLEGNGKFSVGQRSETSV